MRSTPVNLENSIDESKTPTSTAFVLSRATDYLELVKPRLVLMVLITTAAGFYIGAPGAVNWIRCLHTVIGSGLTAAGVLGLNQYLERYIDAQMERTQARPLPDGRILPIEALLFSAFLTGIGMLYLTFIVNPLSGFILLLIVVSYLFLYTPLKQKTSLCTLIGAIPGALPPVVGWAAARGTLSGGTWVLFAILFLWQLPHSLAIAYIYRKDYANARLRLLPVIHPDGASTRRQIIINCAALLGIGLLPALFNIAGDIYFFTALLSGIMFLAFGFYLEHARSVIAARYLMYASLLYLPLIFITMAFDKI